MSRSYVFNILLLYFVQVPRCSTVDQALSSDCLSVTPLIGTAGQEEAGLQARNRMFNAMENNSYPRVVVILPCPPDVERQSWAISLNVLQSSVWVPATETQMIGHSVINWETLPK